MNEYSEITKLFEDTKAQNTYINVSAPMVRYSKLEFRSLLRQNNVGLCFTPMIIADSFIHSQEARLSEFTTNKADHPLIAQFAANNPVDMLAASEIVCPFVNGVDLNCGCPQSWAIAKGYGCALLRKPEIVEDIIKTLRRNLPSTFSISLKLRLLQNSNTDLQSTIDMCRQMEKCGPTFLIIHGRTQWQKTSYPVDVAAMAAIKKSLQIPLIVNGDVKTKNDADKLFEQTQANGVMAARGLLANPSLFTGTPHTSEECLQNWLDIANAAGDELSFQNFHHHLTFMWGKLMRRRRRVTFNNISTKSQVFAFFDEHYGIKPRAIDNWIPNSVCDFAQDVRDKYYPPKIKAVQADESYSTEKSDGTFFTNYKRDILHQEKDDDDANSDEEGSLFFQNGSIFDA